MLTQDCINVLDSVPQGCVNLSYRVMKDRFNFLDGVTQDYVS
jgi:hypothetical protein